MIRETLTAIGLAGRQALQGLGSRVAVHTQVNQVRDWSFAMPYLGRVTVANSPIHQVYVGFAQPLVKAIGDPARLGALLETFKQELVVRAPAKRPIGAWEMLPPDAAPRVLRGVRSFILRQQTAAGNLYLMADLASRGEFETLRESGWEDELAARLLPRDVAKLETVDDPLAIDRIGTYLARFEHDLELLVPAADGTVRSANGVLLQLGKLDDRAVMRLSLDVDRELRERLQPGLEIEGSFGAAGRVFRFRTRCAGYSLLPLEGLADLPCGLFEMPSRFALDQRRRYFRIELDQVMMAELGVLPMLEPHDEEAELFTGPVSRAPLDVLPARILDLSFSGVGLMLPDRPPPALTVGGHVHLRLSGDGLGGSIELSGVVRRLAVQPCGRGRYETHLGVEFMIDGNADRHGTQQVRQYVMAQQRQLLAKRSEPASV